MDRGRFLQTTAGLAGLVALGRLPGDIARARPPRFDIDWCQVLKSSTYVAMQDLIPP
jgi:hypothetical protein